ncbi:MAG: PQQ-binding-like beta-propeller repeat protein [Candidatus Latescibacteria bacterium]|nr:PQQ-binding-like beta-propeller repeat protein [Candidatus Latescibacterota bacterium]MBT4141095.1 PQQ-binding-like beta-propeller repeat protein [Candidatus Latescibacterota bacterium]
MNTLNLAQAGQKNAVIVTPPDGSLNNEAEQLVHSVRAHYNVQLDILSGDQAVQALPTQHAIALGCLADNPFIASLYYRWNTLADRWYPGTNGWLIQFIPSPNKQGDHVLILGGSDPQGVREATHQFIEQLQTNPNGQIPWQLQVQLGQGHLPLPQDRMDCLGTAASPILTPESALPEKPYESGFTGDSISNHLLRLGMYGPHADNYHFSRSSQLGLRYLYTGDLEDAKAYHQTLLEEMRSGALQTLYHYKSIRMFQLWSLLNPCPVFTDTDRDEITQAIRTYLIEESGIATINLIQETSKETEIFSRHHACDALNLWVGADWLYRLTGEAKWLTDRTIADTYFQAQSGTDVPLTGLTEGYASYLEVYLEWMLLSCPNKIANDPHINLWAQRVMGLCTNTGQLVTGPQTDASRYPYNLMRKLAHLLNDGRYLFVANLREHQVKQGMDRVLQFSAGQAYRGDIEAREPKNEIGLRITPTNERLRQWQAPSIKPNQGFDRATARSGWSVEDDYLMVIGMRSGGKSLPNVGALAAYERFGQRLITSDAMPLFPHCASPWRHSTVTANIGGLGTGMAEGAKLLTQNEVANGHLLSYQIDTPGLCRWIRQIFWKPTAYVLIVDRVFIEPNDPFTLGVNWRCAGQTLNIDNELATLNFNSDLNGQFYVQVSKGLHLTSETNTYPALGAPLETPPISETMLHATTNHHAQDGEISVATLLHAAVETTHPIYHLNTHDTQWTVQGPNETHQFAKEITNGEMAISIGPQTKQKEVHQTKPTHQPHKAHPTLPTRWTLDLPDQVSTWTQTTNAIALGTKQGHVILLDAEGNTTWTTQCDTSITALTFFNNDLFVGTHSGQVIRFNNEGSKQWHYACQFREERAFWPWWFLNTPIIGALSVAHDPASDQDIVAIGTGGTSLNFLNAKTGILIDDVVSPYGWPDQIQAHTSAHTNQLQFLVGHSYLTCGSTVRAWSLSPQAEEGINFDRSINAMGRSMGGWDSCGVRDFWVGPLINEAPDQVIVLRHGAVNQLTAYNKTTGDPLWDVGLGGSPVALSVVPNDSAAAARCYVAEQFGGLVCFDGTGKQVMSMHIAQSLRGMYASSNGCTALWNLKEMFIVQDDQIMNQYRLNGYPLGWFAHAQNAGLLCINQEQLLMTKVRRV